MPLAELAALIQRARRLLAFCHVNPDGDAIGSLLGLGQILDALPGSRSVHLICQDPAPAELHFLPGVERIVNQAPPGFEADLIICVDASDPARLGRVFAELGPVQTPVVVIDHHITNLHFGAYNYVAPETASTSQLIVALADVLGLELTRTLAFPLMVGLVTDTLGFRTSNVTSAELACAVRLVDAGANLADIAQRTLLSKPLKQMRLWGDAFVKATLEDGVISVDVTDEMRLSAGILDEDDGGLVSQLIMAAEARIAVVFSENISEACRQWGEGYFTLRDTNYFNQFFRITYYDSVAVAVLVFDTPLKPDIEYTLAIGNFVRSEDNLRYLDGNRDGSDMDAYILHFSYKNDLTFGLDINNVIEEAAPYNEGSFGCFLEEYE